MDFGFNRGGFLSNLPVVTKNIIITNLIVFTGCLLNEEFMIRTFAMFYPTSTFFHPWQVLTHMFMHGGFWHIFFNMYTLYVFGSVIERAIGPKKFGVLFFVTGFGAVALHTGVEYLQVLGFTQSGNYDAISQIQYTPTVGASGAIYGVLIAYAMLYPDSVLTLIFPPVSLKAKWMVIIFAALELVTGITGTVTGIAHFAHLGGMLFGWILMYWWKKSGRLYYRDRWI